MQIRINPEIFEQWPATTIGVVVALGIDRDAAATEALAIASAADQTIVDRLRTVDHERIGSWRDVYTKFGAKPRSYQCSVERLLKRSIDAGNLPRVSPLVDIGNAISVLHVLPTGVEDVDKLSNYLELRFASGGEAAVTVIGETEARTPKPGEVIYADSVGVVCRRWNWKETPRTMVSATTVNAAFIFEITRDEDARALDSAVHRVVEIFERSAQSCTKFMLNQRTPNFTVCSDA